MSKNKNNSQIVTEEEAINKDTSKTEKIKQKENNKKAKNQKGGKKNKNEGVKLSKKAKETVSELKKVVWPTFGEVCKKTGVVLVVVLIFAVIIFGMDYGLGALMRLLTKR